MCGTLFRTLLFKRFTGKVHSVFDRAVNLDMGDEMISVLCSGRSLLPFSVRTAERCSFRSLGLIPGMSAEADSGGIRIGESLTISLDGTKSVDLSVPGAFPECGVAARPDPEPVLEVLREIGDEQGLSALAVPLPGNVYSDLIGPRLEDLYGAVDGKDAEAAEYAAARIAGCGVGLTPSSDDLLNGFFAVTQVRACLEGDPLLSTVVSRAAHAASEKTNRISGTFLTQIGRGQASEDVLHLLRLVFSGSDADLIRKAAFRVAEFGSTSGTDTLTGIVLAIIHQYGGKNSG